MNLRDFVVAAATVATIGLGFAASASPTAAEAAAGFEGAMSVNDSHDHMQPQIGQPQIGQPHIGRPHVTQNSYGVDGAVRAVVTRPTLGRVGALKIMNYYPSNAAWSEMWWRYDHEKVSADFRAIRSIGANTVRLIVQPQAFGYPGTVRAAAAANLSDAISTASAHGLRVQLTLFDWWQDYGHVERSKIFARELLGPYRNDDRIALVEAQNEVNPSSPQQLTWLRAILPDLHDDLPGVPTSISLAAGVAHAGWARINARIPHGSLDVLSAHLYGPLATMSRALDAAIDAADGRPVIVGEAGYGVDAQGSRGSYMAQKRFFQTVWNLCRSRGLSWFAPWILNDLAEDQIAAKNRDTDQARFGLRWLGGTWKPAASVVRAMFASAAATGPQTEGTGAASPPVAWLHGLDLDNGFEQENSVPDDQGLLGAWQVIDQGSVKAVGVTTKESRAGAAGYLLGSKGSQARAPGLAQMFTVGARASVRVGVFVKLGGVREGVVYLSIAWFSDRGYISNSASMPADLNSSVWQHLQLTASAPPGAVRMQVAVTARQDRGFVYVDDLSVR